MKNYKPYVIIFLIIFATLVGYFIYSQIEEKNAVTECSAKASQAVKENNPTTSNGINPEAGNQIYDVFFKACMGKNGYEIN